MSPPSLNKILKIFLSLIASYYILIYLIIGAIRLFYPFELEWMEGAVIDHLRWILAGHQLYVKPSIDFVPFIYPPFYYYLSAGLAKIIGIGFLAPRLVSYLSSVGIFIFIFLLIKKETKNNFAGFMGSALFAATYRISGAWFDVARVDTLFILFLVLGIYVIREWKEDWKCPVFGALIFVLAYFTKQQALPVAMAVSLYYLFENRRHFFVYTLIFGSLAGGITLLLNYITEGWYGFYILKLPLAHPIISSIYYNYWIHDLWYPLASFLIVILFFFLKENFLFVRSREGEKLRFYLIIALGCIGTAFVSRLHSGGWNNVLLPAYLIIAILFGIALHFILSRLENVHFLPAKTILPLCLIIQFLILFYNPQAQIPRFKDRIAYNEFLDRLKSFGGEVFIPSHGYLPSMVGLKTYANWAAVYDILRAKDGFAETIKVQLLKNIQDKINKRQFEAIILDNDKNLQKYLKFDPYYWRDTIIFTDDKIGLPVTGVKFRPAYIYLPNF